jgi:hypothetical protein
MSKLLSDKELGYITFILADVATIIGTGSKEYKKLFKNIERVAFVAPSYKKAYQKGYCDAWDEIEKRKNK